MKTGKILAIFGLLASSFSVFIRVMTPTTVQIIIEGNIVQLNEIPHIYNSWDMAVTSVSCFVLGSSLIYLLLIGKNEHIQNRGLSIRETWNNLLENLSNDDEKELVQLIIAEGGTIFQSQLVEKSGYSKSKVSLVLDRLEARNILERRRRGMSNVIILK
jgi:uncharacterized membrane protein